MDVDQGPPFVRSHARQALNSSDADAVASTETRMRRVDGTWSGHGWTCRRCLPYGWHPVGTSDYGKPMPNDRLRTSMLERGVTPVELAAVLDVDPKSVERWISGRTPYRRHRYAVAAHLGVDETYLWPDALSPDQVANASESEIINVYPHRWTVPSDLWRNHFDNAESEIGILVYSGLFVSEDAGIQRILRKKADAGARVRILLGDPTCEAVAQRGADEASTKARLRRSETPS